MLWPTGLSPVCGKPNIGRFDGCVTALREIEARFSIANRLGAWSANPHVSNSAQYFPPNSAQNFPVHAVIFGCFFLCLNRKESFPVSRISQ